MFESLSDKLKRTLKNLRGEGVLTKEHVEAALREIRLALLEADVNYKVAKDFIASVKEKAEGQQVWQELKPSEQVVKIVFDELVELLGGQSSRLVFTRQIPNTVMVVGLQGSGKTTSSGKIARWLATNQDRKPLLLSVDVYRPAAREQLKVIARATGQQIFEYPETNDPLTLVREAHKHAFLSAVHAVPQRFDAALICNAANAPFAPILRLTGTPVAINVDGLEHKRKKWGWLGRRYYRLAEYLSTLLPNEMVTDAQVIQNYYLAQHNAESTMIAYGSEVERRPDRALVRKWRVEPNRYVLYVSRLEPENNAHLVIEAFKRVRTAYRLLIVGDAPYAEEYISDLKARAKGDKRIIFTGFVFGQDYRALQQNAYCYVHDVPCRQCEDLQDSLPLCVHLR